MMAAQLQQSSAEAASSNNNNAGALPPMANRARESRSPYVLAHADGPVKWQPLDEETIERARRENKLIFMNIGFRACHYCRLTTFDSFSHPAVADLLNSSFVPVIVDREERPDLDAIYMNYVQAVNSVGGWPLNLFLTPELEPVFGGTYLPGPGSSVGLGSGGGGGGGVGSGANDSGGAVAAAGGRTSRDEDEEEEQALDLLVILQKLKKVWTEQQARCRKEAKEILVQLREFAAEGTLGTRTIGATGKPTSSAAAATASVPPLSLTPSITTPQSAQLASELDLDQLEEAAAHMLATHDPVHGGFGLAPKFPTPPRLAFLLGLSRLPPAVQHVVGSSDCAAAKEAALKTLRCMRDGGLRDVVGGGFARYSTTRDWGLPHFEKILPDQALLLGVYLDAWLGSRREGPSSPRGVGEVEGPDEFLDVVLELADYLASPPVALPGGAGFASSEAADSYVRRGDAGHEREGAYYLWTKREFDNVVSGGHAPHHHAPGSSAAAKPDASVAALAFHVLDHGNVDPADDPDDEFVNQNVLRVARRPGELARQLGILPHEAQAIIDNAKQRLKEHRDNERTRPALDDKLVVATNGMAVGALAKTGAALLLIGGSPAGQGNKYLEAAARTAEFIKQELWDAETKVLYRVYREGRWDVQAFAEDYAFLIEGLLELYEATGKEAWLEWADELQKTQLSLFYDSAPVLPSSLPTTTSTSSHPSPLFPPVHNSPPPCGAFFSTTSDSPQAILRLKEGMDTSQPSCNATSASNLFRLAALLGDDSYAALARDSIDAFEAEVLQYPWLFPGLLTAVVTSRLGGRTWIVVVDRGADEGEQTAPPKVPEGSDAETLLKAYHSAPSAGLQCLLFVPTGGADDAGWLKTRNPTAFKVLQAGPKGGAKPGEVYVFAPGGLRIASKEDWAELER